MASIRRTTRCQLMAHLLIKTWYRRIGRSKLNTSEANYYQEQLRNGIPAEAGPNETSRLLGSQRFFFKALPPPTHSHVTALRVLAGEWPQKSEEPE